MSRAAPARRSVSPSVLLVLLVALVGPGAACAGPSAGPAARSDDAASPASPGAPPALVVMTVVDQLRPDMLERYDDLWTGGFRRLLDDGFVFRSGSHAHAVTETAAGHATLATGVAPARHGIVANNWREPTDQGGWRSMYAVADDDVLVVGAPDASGRSPANLLRPGLADWIREANPESRVVSVSRKDRSAITMGGSGTDGHVYWIDGGTGRFVTSSWYRDRLPGWVEETNRRVVAGIMADTVWESAVPDEARARSRPDTADFEGPGGVHSTFPHRAMAELEDPGPGAIHDWVLHSPAPDSAVLEMALAAVDALELGRREAPDFLAVGFSQVDYVGHWYGPLSREQLDNLLHLDRMLGHLFDALDRRVGEGRWVMGFSADHGVLTYPEWLVEHGEWGMRVPSETMRAFTDRLRQVLDQDDGDPAALARRLATEAESFDFVAEAYTHEELRAGGEPTDSFAALYRNSLRDDRAADWLSPFDVELRYRAGVLTGNQTRGTTHGSPYWYDRHVPIILLGGGVTAGTSDAAAYTWDVAPTLAEFAEIAVPGDLDGRSWRPTVTGG